MKKNVLAIAIALLVPAFLYTNCTVPYAGDNEDVSSLAEKGEFAYDATLDQVAYMSCDLDDVYDSVTYFTFRAGAYRNGGLKFQDGFFDNIDSKLNTDEERISYITNSLKNTKTGLQVALHLSTDFQSVFTRSGSATLGQDYGEIFPELGPQAITEPLFYLPAGERLRYLRNGFAKGDLFEADLQINSSYSIAESLREGLVGRSVFLPGQLFLGLTYAGDVNGGFAARSPVDFFTEEEQQNSTQTARNSVYGRGLFFELNRPQRATAANFPTYVISGVNERNLLNINDSSGLGTWTCDAKMQFQIVRPDDNLQANGTLLCPTHADDLAAYPELATIRNSLRVEDWYVHIDANKRCIVPKRNAGSGCYGKADFASSTPRLIEYDLTKTCRPDGGNDAANKACSHFASICVRN